MSGATPVKEVGPVYRLASKQAQWVRASSEERKAFILAFGSNGELRSVQVQQEHRSQ